MPGIDDFEAARRIRKTFALPIIAVTGEASADDWDSCLSVGMNACITKPVSLEALRDTVAHWH